LVFLNGANSASYPVSTGDSFLRVNLPERGTDQSPPSSAEITSAQLHVFIRGALIMYKDTFALLYFT